MKFRKKPVIIEAMQITESNVIEVVDWMGDIFPLAWREWPPIHIEIPTLEGVMKANIGDWIIKGVKGEFYPCKPDIFELTYEKVDEPIA